MLFVLVFQEYLIYSKCKSIYDILSLNLNCVFFFYSFLVNSQKDHDLKKWSAEGLAYLSLDADVKEAIVDDPETLQALMELSKVKHFKGSVAWRLLVNAIYFFFWTTTHKQRDLINSSQ